MTELQIQPSVHNNLPFVNFHHDTYYGGFVNHEKLLLIFILIPNIKHSINPQNILSYIYLNRDYPHSILLENILFLACI